MFCEKRPLMQKIQKKKHYHVRCSVYWIVKTELSCDAFFGTRRVLQYSLSFSKVRCHLRDSCSSSNLAWKTKTCISCGRSLAVHGDTKWAHNIIIFSKLSVLQCTFLFRTEPSYGNLPQGVGTNKREKKWRNDQNNNSINELRCASARNLPSPLKFIACTRFSNPFSHEVRHWPPLSLEQIIPNEVLKWTKRKKAGSKNKKITMI